MNLPEGEDTVPLSGREKADQGWQKKIDRANEARRQAATQREGKIKSFRPPVGHPKH